MKTIINTEIQQNMNYLSYVVHDYMAFYAFNTPSSVYTPEFECINIFLNHFDVFRFILFDESIDDDMRGFPVPTAHLRMLIESFLHAIIVMKNPALYQRIKADTNQIAALVEDVSIEKNENLIKLRKDKFNKARELNSEITAYLNDLEQVYLCTNSCIHAQPFAHQIAFDDYVSKKNILGLLIFNSINMLFYLFSTFGEDTLTQQIGNICVNIYNTPENWFFQAIDMPDRCFNRMLYPYNYMCFNNRNIIG